MEKKEPFWLNKNNMARSLGISLTAFANSGVEPIAKVGRETFFLASDVLEKRLQYDHFGENGCDVVQKKGPHWLNKNNMAKSLGICRTAFTTWGVQPVGKVGRETFFVVADVLKNRHTYDHSIADQSDSKEYFRERTRLTKEQADQLEMKNAVMRRGLAPSDLLELALAKMCSQVSAMLQSIPAKVKKRVPILTASQIGHITREITKAQNAASKAELPWDDAPDFD